MAASVSPRDYLRKLEEKLEKVNTRKDRYSLLTQRYTFEIKLDANNSVPE